MKQIVQTLGTGEISVLDVPAPVAEPGHVLVATRATLISPGTERMLVSFGKAGWLDKARQHPDKVRMVLDKVASEGLLPTLDAVRGKLEESIELGYSNVGTVIGLGAGVDAFRVGERVASNGKHAAVVNVPANLCARVPDEVGDEAASFTVLGAIALQGLRLANPTLGESFAVMGLGLVGLLTVQLLRAHGCHVLAFDYSEERLALAETFGATAVQLSGADTDSAAAAFTRGRGIDGVIIAAATDSNEPVRQAARMSRKRGRIVLVGVAGLELSRADFYEKELSFQVSCSYGPGRYDPEYEQKGRDYPLAFVRWTEGRNFDAVLGAMADGRIQTAPLVSHRIPVERAQEAYDLLASSRPSLGVVLSYAPGAADSKPTLVRVALAELPSTSPCLGLIGAGGQAMRVLLPALRKTGVKLHIVASHGGVSARRAADRFGFELASTDASEVLESPTIDTVLIASRHDSHASLAAAALRARKNVFVEKPLALDLAGIDDVAKAHEGADGRRLMVGFNRRFAPLATRMHGLLRTRFAPLSAVVTVNAGRVPADHWTQDPAIGGGRIVGEACHFIDLLRHFVGHPIASVSAVAAAPLGRGSELVDCATITLGFADGSVGSVHYFANGHRAFPKERVEVFCEGRILQLDNFRALRAWDYPGTKRVALWRQDKGHEACIFAFVRSIADGKPAPIPTAEIFEVSRVSIEAARQLAHGSQGVRVSPRA